jgi:hypothetical protein
MLAARSASVEMAEKRCRQLMTLMMPDRDDTADKYPTLVHRQDQFFSIKHCVKCNPAPKTFTCPVCDAVKAERWQMQVHNMVGPNESCDFYRRKKQKAWARRV